MYNGHFNSIYKKSVVYPEKTKTEDLAIKLVFVWHQK